MPTASNNTDTLSLNDYNAAVIEGYNAAKDGQSLDDALSPLYSVDRQRGIREGFKKYRYSELSDSFKAYYESPSKAALKNILDHLDVRHPQFLKLAATLAPFSVPVQDSVTFVNLELTLNQLLADELNAWYQYYIVAPFLLGDEWPHLKETFQKFADDELNDHASALLNRIHDLYLRPTFLTTPDSWKEYSVYEPVPDTVDGALEVLTRSESRAIENYTKAIEEALSIKDYASADLFKHNLADEQTHFAELLHYCHSK